MHDIYDPPPAPVPFTPDPAEPVHVTAGDLTYLAALFLLLVVGSAWTWMVEPVLGVGVTIAGTFVIFESWFSGLTFLHRHRDFATRSRWMIFLAALAPWLVGMGAVAALMLGLFMLSDWAG